MHQVVIQFGVPKTLAPRPSLLRRWAECMLNQYHITAEVTIRIVDEEEMTHLKATYRHKQGATNILSFPFCMPKEMETETNTAILGDLVICAAIVNKEAQLSAPHDTRAKVIKQHQEAHWAHMVIHGLFHLLGYDHETEKEASVMEALEINQLKKLGFPNPYLNSEN